MRPTNLKLLKKSKNIVNNNSPPKKIEKLYRKKIRSFFKPCKILILKAYYKKKFRNTKITRIKLMSKISTFKQNNLMFILKIYLIKVTQVLKTKNYKK